MLRFFYAVLTVLLTPVFIGHLYWRSLANPDYRERIAERFGFDGASHCQSSIWVHAASVGEVQAAAAMIRVLVNKNPDRPVIVTTMTPTGSERVQSLFGDQVIHRYVPFDLGSAIRRFFDWANPAIVVIVETEIWPNLFHECGLRKVPLVLASARVSARSAGRYRHIVSLFKETLAQGTIVAAQSQADANRFRAMGASPERIHVTGNIKFDFDLDPGVPDQGAAFRQQHQTASRPVWIAASTHAEEEQAALNAHRKVLEQFPDALLLLVPRHQERFQQVLGLIEKNGFNCVTRSSAEICKHETSVFLGDSMGELMTFYAAADVAFVGGSLANIGGHNLLEPASLSLPTLTGPHYYSAPDIASLLIAEGASQVIHNADELGAAVITLLSDQEQRHQRGSSGQRAIEDNRGALEQVLGLIEPLLARASR